MKALVFDVFGTVVDWRTSVIAELTAWGEARGITRDWAEFADRWRGAYQPSMERVRSGAGPWTILDVLHRESLDALLAEFGLDDAATQEDRAHLTRAWHRLHPWPDAVSGLARLKERYIIATLSNGNVSLLVNLAKFARLPWDTVLSAELVQRYKPDPQTYRGAARLLGVEPGELMLVAAHNADLIAAAREGLRTGFVARPGEYGPQQATDLVPEAAFSVTARDFHDLATILDA